MTEKERKKVLRLEIKNRLLHQSDTVQKKADQKITEHLFALQRYQQAEVIFCYVSRQGEVDTHRILFDALKSEKMVGVPKCIEKGRMEVFRICTWSDLEEGQYGILEPKKECQWIAPERIGLSVVPCVCCDRQKARLGYGGGYYDRFLAVASCTSIALCYEQSLVDKIPIEAHDKRMDFVITENGVF